MPIKRTPLEQFRLDRNLRQEDMAKALGINQGYLSRLLSGTAIPSVELCLKIEQITGVVMPRLRDVRRRRPALRRPLEEAG